MRTSYTYHSDEQLAEDFRTGAEEAFRYVYDRFNHGLYHFARRFVSNEDAYDAVADTFVRLWHERSKLDAIPKVERWLFVTVRYHCLNVLRKQVRQRDTQDELLRQLQESEPDSLLSEDILTEIIALLHREIDRLPERQRQVFLLSFQEGLKPSQIAERLELSVKTVKNQKLSAIRLLQAALGHRAILLALLVLLHEERSVAVLQ
jgi:RNA polymerase sigma-70 factor (family 1)